MSENAISTSRYLNNTASVLSAGRQLLGMLDESFVNLDFAITQLEVAAGDQEAGVAGYRAFMFKALEEKPKDKAKRERITEDVFATVVADLQVGNVLVAGGAATGEIEGVEAGPQWLEEALGALEETSTAVSRGLSNPASVTGRFNFKGGAAKKARPAPVESPDLEGAIAAFSKLSEKSLDEFVGGFRSVALSVLKAIKAVLDKIGLDKVMEMLEGLGGPVQTIVGEGKRLVKKGIEKIGSAVEALVRLIGNDALTKIKDSVKQFWEETGQKRLDEISNALLARLVGVEATRKGVAQVLGGGGLDRGEVDRASDEMALLSEPFEEKMEMAKKAVAAIGFVSGLLFLTPVAGQHLAMFAGFSYFVILSAALLIAMDYADSGRVLQRVRGVGEIADGLRKSPQNPPPVG